MPPADSKKPAVTAEEVKLIRQWIDQGAEYDAHWSYVKPMRPAVPAVKQGGLAGQSDRQLRPGEAGSEGPSPVAGSRQADARCGG